MKAIGGSILLGFVTAVTPTLETVAVPYTEAGNREETLLLSFKADANSAAPVEDPSKNVVVLETTTEPETILSIVTSTW